MLVHNVSVSLTHKLSTVVLNFIVMLIKPTHLGKVNIDIPKHALSGCMHARSYRYTILYV